MLTTNYKEEKYIDSDGQELTKMVCGFSGDIIFKNKEGNWHRLDGPAHIWHDGTKAWFKGGLRHREDGPAVIWPNGTLEYWINGRLTYKRETNLYCWLKEQVE